MTAPSALRARCDLDALEAKAKAATPGPWSARLKEPGYVLVGPDERAPGVFSAADARFIMDTDPLVIFELVRRLRAAEAIVRDLAAREPTKHGWVHGADWIITCVDCNQFAWANEDGKARTSIAHAESCAYKRAVDATRREESK